MADNEKRPPGAEAGERSNSHAQGGDRAQVVDITLAASTKAAESDAAWFARHPHATWRLRPYQRGEFGPRDAEARALLDACPGGLVMVQQFMPGVRGRSLFWPTAAVGDKR